VLHREKRIQSWTPDIFIHVSLHLVESNLPLGSRGRTGHPHNQFGQCRSTACTNQEGQNNCLSIDFPRSLQTHLSGRATHWGKQDYSLWKHLGVARARETGKWTRVAGAHNEAAAIFIFVFGKSPRSHSTTQRPFFLLPSPCRTMSYPMSGSVFTTGRF
jgi:hypothetical protein